jgi:hypothetical protein
MAMTRRISLAAMATLGVAVTSAAPSLNTEQAVLATVQTLIDAWREADVSKAASVLHDSYRITSLQDAGAGIHVFVDTRQGLLAAVAKLHRNQWDVRLAKTTVAIDPNGMATVWAKYEFFSDGTPNHCGYELYTLFHFAAGWKIVGFADTDTALNGRDAARVCPG